MKTHSIMMMIFAVACILLSAARMEAAAQSNIGFKGIGPRIGFVDPEGSFDGAVEFGLAFEFGEFVRQLHWDGSVSFWSTGRDYRYFNGNHFVDYGWRLRDFILRSGVNYHFVEGEWVPYAGGGLGLHFFSWNYNGAPYYNNMSDTRLGLYIDGGIEHKFNPNWTGQMQVQFDFANTDQTALLFNLIYSIN